MKIPEKLKVGGRDYEVIYPHRFEDSADVLYGLHDGSGQTIKIASMDSHGGQRCEQAIANTFLHETIHAISMVYGCKLGSLENGEDIVAQLAEGLFQVIRDNDLDFRNKP
jgi:hypothetical protein